MEKTASKTINIHISEDQTILDLNRLVQGYESEIYLKKILHGNILEVNLKSLLGLVTLQLKNNQEITVRAVGEDCDAALEAVVEFFT